jgi:hypothetical protein
MRKVIEWETVSGSMDVACFIDEVSPVRGGFKVCICFRICGNGCRWDVLFVFSLTTVPPLFFLQSLTCVFLPIRFSFLWPLSVEYLLVHLILIVLCEFALMV